MNKYLTIMMTMMTTWQWCWEKWWYLCWWRWWWMMLTLFTTHSSLLCQEWNGLIHAAALRANVPFTALANLGQF